MDAQCAGGSCGGVSCTAKKISECNGKNCGCQNMKCTGGQCCDNKPEICDGKDNDCDGTADNGNPGGGVDCDTQMAKPCNNGKTQCKNGKLICFPIIAPQVEKCNGHDDDCNGRTDENNPEGGHPCNTGIPNTKGITQCLNGRIVCKTIPLEQPKVEPTYPPEPTTKNDASSQPEPSIDKKIIQETSQKLPLGTNGCKNSNDCQSGLCVKLANNTLCTQRCSNDFQCPHNYYCREKRACWPKNDSKTSSKSCPNGKNCDIEDLRVVGGGCSCQTTSSNPPFFLLLFLLLLPFFLSSPKRTH